MLLRVLLMLTVLVLTHGVLQDRGDGDVHSELFRLKALVEDLRNTTKHQGDELKRLKEELSDVKDVPKVAFSASLGGNGLVKSEMFKKLIYKDVITNIGEAYNRDTGIFTAPVRGVYYVRLTANSPTEGVMSSVLYKGSKILLIVHEQPSGEGSDTASNGATFLLEKGDQLHVELWPNTQIWDNANRHSTVTAFLLFPMPN